VSNGGPFGTWSKRFDCPTGTKATGFSLKVEEEPNRIFGLIPADKTALNGIRLVCSNNQEIEPYTQQ